MSKEIWKDIEGYEGLYQVSNLGRVKSNLRKGRILKPSTTHDGYYNLTLSKNGQLKTYRVHRLVCSAFISNPLNKSEVNHIDGNKKNNSIENLEWCTRSENAKHAHKTGLNSGKKVSVYQFDKLGRLVKTWKSQTIASKELRIPQSLISSCCKWKRKHAGGFTWRQRTN